MNLCHAGFSVEDLQELIALAKEILEARSRGEDESISPDDPRRSGQRVRLARHGPLGLPARGAP